MKDMRVKQNSKKAWALETIVAKNITVKKRPLPFGFETAATFNIELLFWILCPSDLLSVHFPFALLYLIIYIPLSFHGLRKSAVDSLSKRDWIIYLPIPFHADVNLEFSIKQTFHQFLEICLKFSLIIFLDQNWSYFSGHMTNSDSSKSPNFLDCSFNNFSTQS